MSPPKTREAQIFGGLVAANVAAFALMLMAWMVVMLTNRTFAAMGNSVFFFAASDFLLIPIVMGALMAYSWRGVQFTRSAFVGYVALSLLILLVQSVAFLHEGVVCIVMALPLVLLFLWIGFLLGKAIAARNSKRLNLSLAPLLFFALIADVLTNQGYEGQVVDKIVVRASPAVVWRYIVAYPAITEAPDYWLWKLGLPAPLQSTATDHAVGAQRKCIFTDNLYVICYG